MDGLVLLTMTTITLPSLICLVLMSAALLQSSHKVGGRQLSEKADHDHVELSEHKKPTLDNSDHQG
jgi:hypothetical protein